MPEREHPLSEGNTSSQETADIGAEASAATVGESAQKRAGTVNAHAGSAAAPRVDAERATAANTAQTPGFFARLKSNHHLLYLLAAVAQAVGPLISQPFVYRRLDSFEWGTLALCISTISIGLIMVILGLPTIITRVYFRDDNGVAHARSLAAFSCLFSSGFVALLVLIAGVLAAFAGSLHEQFPLVLAIASLAALALIQMSLAILRAEGKVGSFVILTICAQLLGHLLGAVAVFVIAPTALVYVLAFTATVSLTALCSIVLARPHKPFKFPRVIAQAFRTALPIFPHSLALVLMLQGESFVITAQHGSKVYGVYGVVLPFALGSVAVVLALANVWEVLLFALQRVPNTTLSYKIQREAIAITAFVACLGAALSQFVLIFLVGNANTEQRILAILLPLTGLGYAFFLMAITQLIALGKTLPILFVTLTVAVLTLLGEMLAGREQNLVAVGVFKVLGFFFLGLVYTVIARRYGKHIAFYKPAFIAYAISGVWVALLVFVFVGIPGALAPATFLVPLFTLPVFAYLALNKKIRAKIFVTGSAEVAQMRKQATSRDDCGRGENERV